MPQIARSNKTYTKIFATNPSSLTYWIKACTKSLDALYRGTDMWSNFSNFLEDTGSKVTDLLCIMGQADAWNNSGQTSQVAKQYELFFERHPGFRAPTEGTARPPIEAPNRTESVLTFSVRVSPHKLRASP